MQIVIYLGNLMIVTHFRYILRILYHIVLIEVQCNFYIYLQSYHQPKRENLYILSIMVLYLFKKILQFKNTSHIN